MFYACNKPGTVVHCFTYETARRGKQAGALKGKERNSKVSDVIWETFDGLFKTLHRQGRRVEELEARVVELERRLQERAGLAAQPEPVERAAHIPTERAA